MKHSSKRQAARCLLAALLVAPACGCTTAKWFKHKLLHPGQPITKAELLSAQENEGVSAQPTSIDPHVAAAVQLASSEIASKEDIAAGAEIAVEQPVVAAAELQIQPESGEAIFEMQGEPAAASFAPMSLEEFEGLALGSNPALRTMAATVRKAAGFRAQVGLWANPTVGYQAVQLADEGTDQHTGFVEQEFVTADKLQLNRCVQNEALRAQMLEYDAQRLRVLTDVRRRFYRALAAQQRIDLIVDFQSVADKGVELAELRKEALEGSRVEVLQASVQANEIDLALEQARIAFDAAFRELAAMSGQSHLQPARLTGQLPEHADHQQWQQVAASIQMSSPEYQAAQARIQRARVALKRQGVQAIPNLTVQLAAGRDNSTDSGLINLQVGAPLPVFNQNQGNIAAAQAEYCRAVADAERIAASIASRVASVSNEYDGAAAAVDKYRDVILPNANESLELAETAYQAGETSFIQVLVARRTYFESNQRYLAARADLARAAALVDGLVLSGGLDAVSDNSGDDALRGMTFSQQ